MALGAHIKSLRQTKGFNFDAFVGETELGRGYVSELERGLTMPTLSTLARVAQVLEVELIDLFAFVGSPRAVLVGVTRDLPEPKLSALLAVAREMKGEDTSGSPRRRDR